MAVCKYTVELESLPHMLGSFRLFVADLAEVAAVGWVGYLA